MMLSRAAERVYWLGRYLERAEGTARIVQQYTQLLLDLPESSGVNWTELPTIFGVGNTIRPRDDERVEHAVINALLADRDSAVSLRFSIAAARDNVRNTRDLLPMEVWESINELHVFARKQLDEAVEGEDRFEILSECIARCQQIDGALTNTMSHRSPLQFLRLGQNIERADMTTRVIDVAANRLAEQAPAVRRFSVSLWSNTLRTLSAMQMFRQYASVDVNGPAVVRFLTDDADFPRAIRASIASATLSAERLPQSGAVVTALTNVLELLSGIDDGNAAEVSQAMDRIQSSLAAVHSATQETWFLSADA